MSAFALATFLLSSAVPSAADAPRVVLTGDELRVGDIADAASGAELILARLPEGAKRIELTEEKRRALVRGRLPGVNLALRHRGPVVVERGSAPAADQNVAGGCFSARVEIPSGRYVTPEDIAAADCIAGAAEPRLRYDAAARAPYARAAIPAGSHLGKLRLPHDTPVAAGQSMVLRTAAGPVVIERTVTTVQSARRGERIFVRTGDGQLLASRLAASDGKDAK